VQGDFLKGLVSCIRRYADADDTEYFLFLSEGGGKTKTAKLSSKFLMNAGEVVDIEVKEEVVERLIPLESAEDKETLTKLVEKKAASLLKEKVYCTGIEKLDAITNKLWGKLSKAMLLLARKLVLGAPIVIRFHNDIDGASGAYALYKAIKCALGSAEEFAYEPNIFWRMHGGVTYSREDATCDTLVCNNFECSEKPLLVILDFGTTEESNAGIELMKDRFEVIWLDHHPMVEKFEGKKFEHYVNPWNFGGDSNYTAGFLTCIFAKSLADLDTKDIEVASLIGDYSEHAQPTTSSRKLAALLDLLTSDTRLIAGSKGNLTPDSIEKVVNDKKKSEELIAYAENRVSEMLDIAINSVKVYKGGYANIYVADFESMRGTDDKYPLPGRFASKLLGRIEELNKVPCILFLHFGYFISARMSKALIPKVNLLSVLDEVRKAYPDNVDSSGGHSNAASIKLKKDSMKKEVIKAIVEKLKENA